MNQLHLILQAEDMPPPKHEGSLVKIIPLAVPDAPLSSFQDFILWILEHPEIITQLIVALLSIFLPDPERRQIG